jgi:hypothetical protein
LTAAARDSLVFEVAVAVIGSMAAKMAVAKGKNDARIMIGKERWLVKSLGGNERKNEM